ncbi:hypothetical protein [Dyadobacter sp. CY356]|uniref:hypothetical protein n=1 Tax=Dyadobacter sp. CY356 TaxID=2906442 RepID=UPI001F33999E|nr:hypothetical protein [Dyadobacter sp. CY356]MCF0058529.1 hypothetical protein [Dyadobacter sp. CY356]
MKRLSLEELKAQKIGKVNESLEAIKGGSVADCHGFWERLIDFIVLTNSGRS